MCRIGVVTRRVGTLIATWAIVLLASAEAQEWARKMFRETSHDFGTVARGAKSEYVFEVVNPYKETIHISSVRASCGCATPSIVKSSLNTWEKGGIVVKFNTLSFIGKRSATITVTVDQPYYAEVQLTINGYIRSDVVFDPGIVQFDTVEQGETSERIVDIRYAGRTDWQIVDVRSANTYLEADLSETDRRAGRVDYQLRLRLKSDAPAGYFNDQVIVITNDRRRKQIPLAVEGQVQPSVMVSPVSLNLGTLRPGETVTKNIVVRARKPFRITRVKCEDDCFDIKPDGDQPKTLHLVPVTFTAGDEPGKFAQRIEIETDMAPGTVGACVATVTVRGNRDAEQEK